MHGHPPPTLARCEPQAALRCLPRPAAPLCVRAAEDDIEHGHRLMVSHSFPTSLAGEHRIIEPAIGTAALAAGRFAPRRASLPNIAASALPQSARYLRPLHLLLVALGYPAAHNIPLPVHMATTYPLARSHSISLVSLTQRISFSRIHSRNRFLRHSPTAIKTFLTHAFSPSRTHTRHFEPPFCLVSAFLTQPHATSPPRTLWPFSSCSHTT